LDGSKSPVQQYLDIPNIVKICTQNHVQAVHPGYGFLSENEHFATALEKAGIVFVGPTVENLNMFGDKTSARNMAIASNVPVVPGSTDAFASWQEARDWIADPINKCSYPVIVKALMGGGTSKEKERGRSVSNVILSAIKKNVHSPIPYLFYRRPWYSDCAYGTRVGTHVFASIERSRECLRRWSVLCGKVRRTTPTH
jgi:hypothetical protein